MKQTIRKSVALSIGTVQWLVGVCGIISEFNKDYHFHLKNQFVNILLVIPIIIWVIDRTITGLSTYSCDKSAPFNKIDDIRKNKKNVNDLIIQQIKCINEIYFKDAIDDIIKQNKIDILYARHEVLEKRLKRVDLIYEILYGIMISMIAALTYWLITECGIEGIYIGCGVVILLSLIIFGIKMSRKGIDNSYANMVDKYELCVLDKKIYECEKGFNAH